MSRYTDRDIADMIDGKSSAQERRTRRLAGAFDHNPAPLAEPLNMAEHLPLFQEAAQARMASSISGEIPERLRHHAAVNQAVNAYAVALREAYPATYADEDKLTWAARGKRDDLIKEHQFTAGSPADVLQTVADELHTAAEALTRPTPARVTPAPRAKAQPAKESTPARRIVRVTEQVRPTIR
ncbi:hypothetical protein KM867_09130 [Micrococcus luteus]|uniref:hypothetical protein n=1 Tax=Micrococcus luteus TaxID=1270 RepID=UPI001C219D49|nr:hypothetical protein [Micrococcus luteus]MBU8650793.1 hypothetical protein [Micrococcus luteus]